MFWPNCQYIWQVLAIYDNTVFVFLESRWLWMCFINKIIDTCEKEKQRFHGFFTCEENFFKNLGKSWKINEEIKLKGL